MPTLLLILALQGCKKPADTDTDAPPIDSPLFDIPADATFSLPGLTGPATVVYTEYGIPHVYATNSEDLHRVQGFVVARDRFFSLDLVRRLSTGRVSSLLGDAALSTDLESRSLGMTYVTDLLLESLTPQQRTDFTAYADGFNAYIAAVERGDLPPPSEFVLAAPLVGADRPLDLMEPWTLRDVAAIGGTIAYRLGYETDDIDRADDLARLETLFDGAPFETERRAGAYEFWSDVTPVFIEPSAPGFGEAGSTRSAGTPTTRASAPVEATMRARARSRMNRVQDRFGRDHAEGWGSNAWAVAGSKTTDGRALLAGDGHLELDIPALMYPIGLDTTHLSGGEGNTRYGNLLVGMPVIGAGTNGSIAWSSTQHSGDITDWYAEQLELDADGKPAASLFQGTFRPLVEVDESYEIADVPALGSVGRTEVWTRFTTFDGRWLLDIEGDAVSADTTPAAGQTVVALGTDFVIPRDVDGDGTITAISFDFTGFDKGNLFLLYDTIAKADSVREIHEASKMSQALSQNLMAADHHGDVFYTGYQMVPCRGYLPKENGVWIDGANPTMLLDGTTYGAFTIPVADDFTAIEGDADPSRCVIPHAEYPHSFTPERGYLLTANQDPGGLETDGDRFNDLHHIGGPWDDGYRANTIANALQGQVDANQADLDGMSAIQGIHTSAIGAHHLHHFLAALDRAEAITDPDPDSSAARMQTLWSNNAARFTEARTRLQGWASRGHEAASGVATFYNAPDADEVDDAVATMVFNVWLADLVTLSINDEGFPGKLYQGGGTAGRLRILDRMLNGRGPGNPRNLASYDPILQESVFWDIKTTPEVESSDEVFLLALERSLDFLESPSNGGEEGGFGTTDMSQYVWGLRHQVEFKSLVASYLDDPLLGPVFRQFQIDTGKLPLEPSLPLSDPRRALTWFPRPGDNRAVDAANPGLSGRNFRHGSGPVMRMVFALGPDGVEGSNVIPGGQSGISGSPNYADQTERWLANETVPMRFTVEEVIANAQTRFAFE